MQREPGIRTLCVTHDQDEATSISDRIAVLQGGMIQQIDTPETIFEAPAKAFVADFMGEGATRWTRASRDSTCA